MKICRVTILLCGAVILGVPSIKAGQWGAMHNNLQDDCDCRGCLTAVYQGASEILRAAKEYLMPKTPVPSSTTGAPVPKGMGEEKEE